MDKLNQKNGENIVIHWCLCYNCPRKSIYCKFVFPVFFLGLSYQNHIHIHISSETWNFGSGTWFWNNCSVKFPGMHNPFLKHQGYLDFSHHGQFTLWGLFVKISVYLFAHLGYLGSYCPIIELSIFSSNNCCHEITNSHF